MSYEQRAIGAINMLTGVAITRHGVTAVFDGLQDIQVLRSDNHKQSVLNPTLRFKVRRDNSDSRTQAARISNNYINRLDHPMRNDDFYLFYAQFIADELNRLIDETVNQKTIPVSRVAKTKAAELFGTNPALKINIDDDCDY